MEALLIYAGSAVAGALAFLVLAHFLLVSVFLWILWNWRRPLLADADCPKAAVVLCLRGTDPFLRKTLDAILVQAYPKFDLHVVIDHSDDPARAIVDGALSKNSAVKVFVEPLTERLEACSLKCSAVVQAVKRLKDTCEIVAFLDADTIPHRTWLRELATALMQKNVGAATGNRWYMPVQAGWGALVRYMWNALAIVQMVFYKIAWGGTLAIRTAVFRDTNLLEKWSSAFCEDTMLHTQLKPHGLKVQFVPSLVMINRETTSLSGFHDWVRRQLLCAKLYHPMFLMVVGHSLGVTLLPGLALLVLVVSAALGDMDAAALAGAGFALYVVSLLFLLTVLEVGVRRIAHGRGEPTGWWTPAVLVRLLPAFFLTHFWYAAAMVSALTLRLVEWRRVEYQVDGPWNVRLLEYKPYQTTGAKSMESL